MTCCTPIIQPFNEAVTTIDYTAAMQAEFGPTPNVQVYYRDGTEYVLSDDMSSVKLEGGFIVVDHGGVNVGLIKIF
jgi:hypothetical protein